MMRRMIGMNRVYLAKDVWTLKSN